MAVTFRGSRSDLRRLLSALPALLTGRDPRHADLAEQLHLRVGTAALSLIREAFLDKARDGTDETGLTWPPLKPETIAYNRRHPGLARQRSRAAKRGSNRPSLTAAQDRRWRQLYASRAGGNRATRETRARAAAYAWFHLKAEGATTVLQQYGGTKVEILRDTGILFNSLSAGAPMNRLEVQPGQVTVGTNVPYAAAHHNGTRTLRQRRLWPEPRTWPQRWWDELLAVLLEGAGKLAQAVAQRGA